MNLSLTFRVEHAPQGQGRGRGVTPTLPGDCACRFMSKSLFNKYPCAPHALFVLCSPCDEMQQLHASRFAHQRLLPATEKQG